MSGSTHDFMSCRKLSCEMKTQAAGMLVLGDALQTLGEPAGTHILSFSALCISRVDTGLCVYWHGRSTEQAPDGRGKEAKNLGSWNSHI